MSSRSSSPLPSFHQTLTDCCHLLRQYRLNSSLQSDTQTPLELLRLEFRLLYLMHNFLADLYSIPATETSRYLFLQRMLHPRPEELPELPPLPPPFQNLRQ